MKRVKMKIDRRGFISGISGIAAAHGLAGFAGLAANAHAAPAAPAVLESARQIGAAYLRLRPWEADRGRLLGLLNASLRRLEAVDASAMSTPGKWRTEHFRQAISQDFALNRTVNLEGWIVSETECRLCALEQFLF